MEKIVANTLYKKTIVNKKIIKTTHNERPFKENT
jgi:hypothetical protein